MFSHVFGFHIGGGWEECSWHFVEARDATKIRTKHRMVPQQQRIIQPKMTELARLRNYSIKKVFLKLSSYKTITSLYRFFLKSMFRVSEKALNHNQMCMYLIHICMHIFNAAKKYSHFILSNTMK